MNENPEVGSWLAGLEHPLKGELTGRTGRRGASLVRRKEAGMSEPVAGTTATRYSWDTIEPDHPIEKATRRLVKGERAMVARFVLDEGLDVDPHVHHNEQITIILEGRLLVRIGTIGSDEIREEVLGPGEVIAFPPFAPHGFRAPERVVAFDVFSPPSDKTGIDQD